MTITADALARQLEEAYASRRIVPPPSSQLPGFDLAAEYASERAHVRRRVAEGRRVVGRKVGYANKALWRLLKLDAPLWASMYDDTVVYAGNTVARLAVDRMISPKIEPEIVFKLKAPPAADVTDAAGVLGAVEWLAPGFEIVDCPFPGWTLLPADFVAAFGLHAALIVGEPRAVDAHAIPDLALQLARFTVKLLQNGVMTAEGSGRNVLRSPALCLGELAAAISRQPQAAPLATGELISTGSLTDAAPIDPGEVWTMVAEGIELAPLTLELTSGRAAG